MSQLPDKLTPALLGAAAALAAVAFKAFRLDPLRVEITHQTLSLPRLPEAWQGARVVHLTDLHYGNPNSEHLFSLMVERVNRLEPDLILLTGDYVCHRAAEVAPAMRYLSRLQARHGKIAVLGDHDFYHARKISIPGMEAGLAGAGVTLLRNAGIELPGGLRIAGTDPEAIKVRLADLSRTLRDFPNPHLLLSHSPDLLPEAARHEIAVMLSGHTHGGQVVIPFYGAPVTHTRVSRHHASGWSSMGKTRLYTCRGLSSHYSLRLFCPPEIAVFQLAQADA